MVFDVAITGDTQGAVEEITQLTTSPSLSVVDVKVPILLPTLAPLTSHWYDGVPPLTGVAVKVIAVPSQTLLAEEAMETEGVTEGFTIIETVFELAVDAEAQLTVDIMVHTTTSPFWSMELV